MRHTRGSHAPKKAQTSSSHVRREPDTYLKDKPDMIEANTIYLWQIPSSVDARILRASTQVSALPRAPSEFGIACVNEASKQASKLYSLPSADAQAACFFTQQAQVCNLHLTTELSLSCIRNTSSRPDFRSADNFNCIHADMGVYVPVSAFFVPEHTRQVSLLS